MYILIGVNFTSIHLAQVLQVWSTSFSGTTLRNHANLPDGIWWPSCLADNEVRAYRVHK